MPVYHRTQRLQIYGEKPEVTQLFNDRYRIVVRCKAARDTEAWYNDNKSQIFADFGTLYNAQMSIDGIDSRTGEAYDNMVLVSNAVGYTQTGEYVVTFVYETLTATWTKEQEDTVSSTDNGLRIVERSEVATIAATAPYDEDDIGVSTITSGGKTLYLAGFKDETKAEADAQIGRVTTQWLEAGTLSETLDNVGSQKAKVIEAIGPDPATPTGYSLASKQESSFNGFQTNRFTFLKNNVILSESEDKVGSQLAITQQWFNPTSDPTEDGYSLAREEVSDVDGIPTKQFTFLKDNVELSRTNDYVGSQLAITREFFNPTSDPTETGYSLASKQQSDFEGIKTVKYVFLRDNILLSQSRDQAGSQNTVVEEWFNPSDRDEKIGYSLVRKEESNIDGIPTERYTFMRDCILRVDTPKVGGSQRVSVQAFDMTEAEVTFDLAAVTAFHELIDIQESDYEGIKTSTFVFEVNDFEVRSKTENGLQLLTRTELSITNFTDGDVGTDTYSGLYLAGEEIDNGNTIKKRVSRWAEAGTLTTRTQNKNEGVRSVSTTFLAVEGSTSGDIISREIGSYDGLRTITVTTLQSSDGTDLTGSGGAAKLNYEYQQLVLFTFPGVVDLVREQNHIFPAVRSPVEAKVKADVQIYYQSSPSIASSDYTLDGSLGIWNPSEWCQKISTIDSFINDSDVVQPAYFNAQGIRGCRTRTSITVTGDNGAQIRSRGGTYTPESIELEETTELSNGKSIYRQTIHYDYDVVERFYSSGGVVVYRGPYLVKGKYTIDMEWNGSQWEINYTDEIDDPVSTDSTSGAGDTLYTYSLRTNSWSETYTNATSTTTGTLHTGSGGGNEPQDATWSGINVLEASNYEELSALSAPANTGFNISSRGFWIEGRNVDNGASGKIKIQGGPENPLGKRYVLDVNIKKAFEDIDGNITYMKQVVIADTTPVS